MCSEETMAIPKGPLSEEEKAERKKLEKAVGRKVRKAEYRYFTAVLAERELSVQDVLEQPSELAYTKLWFSLT